jgi:ubiquinol oxidase
MCVQIRSKLRQLTLSNKAVQDREHVRETSGGKVETTR